jgi:hypothetical protein
VVSNLHIVDALADALDNTSTLVSKNDRERALGVLARECVSVAIRSAMNRATVQVGDSSIRMAETGAGVSASA